MKVLLVNGSPNRESCTYTALSEVAGALNGEGIETDFFWIGKKAVNGCIACRRCAETGKCIQDDLVNRFTDMAGEIDGFVFGSPVYYAGMNGALKAFMDRVFFSTYRADPNPFRFKPAAAVVSARRAGTSSALDQLNKYFLNVQMPVVPSRYWNMVHGNTPEEVRQDAEGLQTMRALGRNMAWLLKLKEAGEKAGVPLPRQEERIATNFIR